MTVEEAAEILRELRDKPVNQMTEEEVAKLRQAERVANAARLSGEGIFAAVGRALTAPTITEERQRRAVEEDIEEGVDVDIDLEGPSPDERMDVLQRNIDRAAELQTDLAIAQQKLNVHERAVALQEDPAERFAGEPEQVLPTAEAARDIAQQQLDIAAATRQQDELRQQRQEAERRGRLVGTSGTLPEGFVAERQPTRREAFGLITGDEEPGTREVRPQYREMDVLEFSGKTQEEIIAQQQKLVNAGLLEEGEYWPGWWGAKSQNAYRTALGLANERGVRVEEVISGMTRARRGEEEDATASRIAQIRSRAFTPPDYTTLAQTSKEFAESRLGRDMKDYEVQLMAKELRQAHRAKHEAQIEADVAEFRAQEEAGEEGEPTSAGEVEVPDPKAHFKASFEERFGKELEHIEQVEEKHENHQLLMRSLRGMDRLVG